MTSSSADLMRRNLLEVFNEPDPARGAAVIAVTYTEDVVWHEPDRIVRGRKELERRAEELRAENPDWVFRPVGAASGLDDIGHLGFQYGPAEQPVATGMDIARIKDGVIVNREDMSCGDRLVAPGFRARDEEMSDPSETLGIASHRFPGGRVAVRPAMPR